MIIKEYASDIISEALSTEKQNGIRFNKQYGEQYVCSRLLAPITIATVYFDRIFEALLKSSRCKDVLINDFDFEEEFSMYKETCLPLLIDLSFLVNYAYKPELSDVKDFKHRLSSIEKIYSDCVDKMVEMQNDFYVLELLSRSVNPSIYESDEELKGCFTNFEERIRAFEAAFTELIVLRPFLHRVKPKSAYKHTKLCVVRENADDELKMFVPDGLDEFEHDEGVFDGNTK